MTEATAPLSGLRILDLSRVLAGPWATQLLADLGAEVIKIEKPGEGDETRSWGPPWLDVDGAREASYYLSANRGKRSVCIDFARPEGARLIARLAARSDVLVENLKVGTLARYGLDHGSLATANPALIYCSITGFGQDGPYADRPGYDFIIQAMGGLMSLTGATSGEPMRAGVAVIDLMTGLYAANAIQAAVRHRERTGRGQAIDMALLDVQVATLANQALGYLVSGHNPRRWGNAHPSIVPYQSFATIDGDIAVAAANDGQFSKLCGALGAPSLAADPRYARNADRVSNRAGLIARLQTILADGTTAHWLCKLEAAGVPAGPVNDIAAVFADPQVVHRGMRTASSHPTLREVPGVRSPIRLSDSPVGAKSAPPPLGYDTRAVLSDQLGLEQIELDELCAKGVIG